MNVTKSLIAITYLTKLVFIPSEPYTSTRIQYIAWLLTKYEPFKVVMVHICTIIVMLAAYVQCCIALLSVTFSLTTAFDDHLQTANNLLVKLQAIIANGNSGLQQCLPHVNATLKKLAYTCDAACKMDTTVCSELDSFDDKENFAPGKKMDLQPRFTATSNTPGRKRKNVLRYVNNVTQLQQH